MWPEGQNQAARPLSLQCPKRKTVMCTGLETGRKVAEKVLVAHRSDCPVIMHLQCKVFIISQSISCSLAWRGGKTAKLKVGRIGVIVGQILAHGPHV